MSQKEGKVGGTGNCKSVNDYVNVDLRVIFLLYFGEFEGRAAAC